jgi:hypothetical protein
MVYQFTTADVGKILGFPLPQSNGVANNFTGCTAVLQVRDAFGNNQPPRTMVFNPSPPAPYTPQWEYAVQAGEFKVGRYFARVHVTFPAGDTEVSSEVVFDVVQAD